MTTGWTVLFVLYAAGVVLIGAAAQMAVHRENVELTWFDAVMLAFFCMAWPAMPLVMWATDRFSEWLDARYGDDDDAAGGES